jgi:hypothetical protein
VSKATDAARDDAYEAAEAFVSDALDTVAAEAVLYGKAGNAVGSIVDHLRVVFGLAHPSGPHHPAPGFASRLPA